MSENENAAIFLAWLSIGGVLEKYFEDLKLALYQQKISKVNFIRQMKSNDFDSLFKPLRDSEYWREVEAKYKFYQNRK